MATNFLHRLVDGSPADFMTWCLWTSLFFVVDFFSPFDTFRELENYWPIGTCLLYFVMSQVRLCSEEHYSSPVKNLR